jgi:hypothetical protein
VKKSFKVSGILIAIILNLSLLVQPVYAIGPQLLANGNDIPVANNSTPINVISYGASGSSMTTSGSILANSNKLTASSALDFKNGQGISIMGAGPTPTISAPTRLIVTPVGTGASKSYTYAVAAFDGYGGITAAYTATTTTSNDKLSINSYNALSTNKVANAMGYAWWRISTNGSEPTGFIGVVSGCDNGPNLIDNGLPVMIPPWNIPMNPPTSAIGDILTTSIISGGGTTQLTLAANASNTIIDLRVRHNDALAIQNALDVASSNNSNTIVYFPAGTYYGGSSNGNGTTVEVPSNITIAGAGANQTILTDIKISISSTNIVIKDLANSNTVNVIDPFELTYGADKVLFKNVTVSNALYTNMYAAFLLYVSGTQTISNINFDTCTVSNISGNGFTTLGDNISKLSSVTNVNFINCTATRCGGFANNDYTAYADGFDLGENKVNDLNISFSNCTSSYCEEDGFHQEWGSTDINVVYRNCVSDNNGQKIEPVYGNGFMANNSTTMINCKSWNNYKGFEIAQTSIGSWYNTDVNLVNCIDDGSKTGVYIHDINQGKVSLNVNLSNNSAYGLSILSVSGNSSVDGRVGESDLMNRIGSPTYPANNCSINYDTEQGSVLST